MSQDQVPEQVQDGFVLNQYKRSLCDNHERAHVDHISSEIYQVCRELTSIGKDIEYLFSGEVGGTTLYIKLSNIYENIFRSYLRLVDLVDNKYDYKGIQKHFADKYDEDTKESTGEAQTQTD